MHRFIYFSLFFFIFIACKNEKSKRKKQATFTNKIETAHAKEDLNKLETICFDIVLFFGGKERLNAKMQISAGNKYSKIEWENGDKIVTIDQDIYHSSKLDIKNLRFTAFTWSYFFMLPYKLNDPGTKWEKFDNKLLNNKTYEVQKLSFDDNVCDSPDDWYIVYADPKTNLLKAAAYIVTAGNKSLNEAENDPHAIVYDDYKYIKDIPISHAWSFYEWNKDSGLGKELGNARISNVHFKKLVPEDFIAARKMYKKLD